jgi:hypothetical protein
MTIMHEVPPALRQKLPMEFTKLGHATHHAFDALAEESKSMGDGKVVLKQLETILRNCNTCHASYCPSGR